VDHIEKALDEVPYAVKDAGSVGPGAGGGGQKNGRRAEVGEDIGGDIDVGVRGTPEKADVGRRPVLQDPPRMPRQNAWKKRSQQSPVKRSNSVAIPRYARPSVRMCGRCAEGRIGDRKAFLTRPTT
jgi:hypothetical protein